MQMAYLQWDARTPDPSKLPILLLHGSPGDASNFQPQLGPLLADAGYTCFAPDLPGFGESSHWVADYSVRAHAHAVLALMDSLAIERAHLVVWSMGGGVSINMADLAPDRVASITLMAAIGAQEGEGSGDYLFEHAKYGLGYLAFVIGAELVPIPWHADRWWRHSWIRNFFDTDQRPLAGIMREMDVPTLILQGRHDFLVPFWAAELHHDLIKRSELVMFDASHFLPVIPVQAEKSSAWIADFLARVEAGQPIGGEVNFAPHPVRTWPVARAHELAAWIRSWHWLMQALLFAAIARVGVTPALGLAGVLRATESVNLAVSLVGILAIRILSRDGPRITRPHQVALCGLSIWSLSFAAWIFASLCAWPWADRLAGPGLILGLLAVLLVVHVLRGIWTRHRRQRMLASLFRIANHEFWPTWLFYLPLAPWLCLLAIRHRAPLVFTCCNPGISHGGGVTGESKIDILNAFQDRSCVLEAHVIAAGPAPADRAQAARRCMQDNERLNAFPIVLKPLAGERGVGVAIARSQADVTRYFQQHHADVIIQQYDPGPLELGVLWVRNASTNASEKPAGRIHSITIKEFPSIVGDGKRSIRQRVLAHPRFRCQADMFLQQLADRADDIPAAGERVDLSGIGNHARGAIFRDGAALITPALSARIDTIAQSFAGKNGAGLDFARFDIRVPSADHATRAEQLAIVELNGVLAESTNLYDPSRSVLWAYRVLFNQWATVYKLGALRRRAGAKPMSTSAFVSMLAQRAD